MPRASTLPVEIVQSMYDTLLRIITHRAGIDEYGVRLIDLVGELIARQLHQMCIRDSSVGAIS